MQTWNQVILGVCLYLQGGGGGDHQRELVLGLLWLGIA